MNREKTLAEIQASGNVSGNDSKLNKYMNELNKITKLGRVEANTIQVKEFADHKNISLWTKEGKRVGPMHRTNAERAFKMFWEMGIELSTQMPTPAEIEAYKQTDEYKAKNAEHLKKRERKEQSRKKGEIDKLAKEIAKMSGQTVEAINNIFKAHEVKPVSEGIKSGGSK